MKVYISLIRVRYSKRKEHHFDVFIRDWFKWKLYRTCDSRSDYLRELGFNDPEVNAYIEMRVNEMFND